jgi:hypothetical protein
VTSLGRFRSLAARLGVPASGIPRMTPELA